MNESDISRTKLHEQAMICIFQYLFYKSYKNISNYKKIDEIVYDVMDVNFDNCEDFFKAIIFETISNSKQYITIIESHLIKWTFKRLCLVDQAILLLFTTEIINKRVPIQVAIDMACDLAHRYCDDKSYKYINKVLDIIGKENA